MQIEISLDLDGTVVEFENHYISKFGVPKSDLEISKNVSGVLMKDRDFWLSQPLINTPNFIPKCYCTARLIKKDWIKKQLMLNNLPKAPIYQVFGYNLSKAPQLKRANIHCHIDDSLSVFKDLNSKGIPCLLLDSPNNKEWGPVGRIYSLEYEEIEESFYLFKETLFPFFKELL